MLKSLSNNVAASYKVALDEAKKVWAKQFDIESVLLLGILLATSLAGLVGIGSSLAFGN
jgi:hypothetical protein